jgi:hypothetical protein
MSSDEFKGNIVVFFHIPKTAGTTIRERYQNSNNFYLVDDDIRENPLWYPQVTENSCFIGHDVVIGNVEKIYPAANVVYITALRDPVERIMSSYNFIKTQAKYMNSHFTGDLDFLLWYANRDVMRPMPHLHQYQYVFKQHVSMKQFYKSGSIMDDEIAMKALYMNTDALEATICVASSGHHQTVTTINTKKQLNIRLQANKVEKQNSEFALGLVTKHFSDIFFVSPSRSSSQNFCERFDGILEKYEVDATPDKEIIRTNDTKLTIENQGIPWTFFHDLPEEYKRSVKYDQQWEQTWFENIKKEWDE